MKKRDPFARYGERARKVLDALLDKYADDGVLGLDDPEMLTILPFARLGTPYQLIKAFGDREDFERAARELQCALYRESA